MSEKIILKHRINNVITTPEAVASNNCYQISPRFRLSIPTAIINPAGPQVDPVFTRGLL